MASPYPSRPNCALGLRHRDQSPAVLRPCLEGANQIWQNEQVLRASARNRFMWRGEILAKHKRAAETARESSGPSALCCKLGDYVRVGLPWGASYPRSSVWIRVDYCDFQRGIVYGTINGELSQQLGHALRRGDRLAASYARILECQRPSYNVA